MPVQFRVGATTHRFWVTGSDRDRLEDYRSDDTVLPAVLELDLDAPAHASPGRPTCRPAIISVPGTGASVPVSGPVTAWIPTQSASPAMETALADSPAAGQLAPQLVLHPSGLPHELVVLQQTADDAHHLLLRLQDAGERTDQRRTWLAAAAAVQDAVTRYARSEALNRYEVEKQLRHHVRHPDSQPVSIGHYPRLTKSASDCCRKSLVYDCL
ncbi:hypothetical protein ACWDGI_43505 [Streptomyces sp. NPDC001220]